MTSLMIQRSSSLLSLVQLCTDEAGQRFCIILHPTERNGRLKNTTMVIYPKG